MGGGGYLKFKVTGDTVKSIEECYSKSRGVEEMLTGGLMK